jgi:ribosomal protein L40E
VNSDEKTCPFCFEKIKALAVKCRFCFSDLSISKNENDAVNNSITSHLPTLSTLVCPKCQTHNAINGKKCTQCNHIFDVINITKENAPNNEKSDTLLIVSVFVILILGIYFAFFFDARCLPWSDLDMLRRRFNCPSWTW